MTCAGSTRGRETLRALGALECGQLLFRWEGHQFGEPPNGQIVGVGFLLHLGDPFQQLGLGQRWLVDEASGFGALVVQLGRATHCTDDLFDCVERSCCMSLSVKRLLRSSSR
ncbi:hypothetical protein DMH04_35050 [Kibdelosporangium aridum]|uniref:Uncharacterized protein n=1 Tax=Kibdelosporangium aridum TaxID=2030 RepID=A0A428YZS8_KIBAR|nr:hypothetical protein DMH04_35050 [Kibdelosporangium aridum]